MKSKEYTRIDILIVFPRLTESYSIVRRTKKAFKNNKRRQS